MVCEEDEMDVEEDENEMEEEDEVDATQMVGGGGGVGDAEALVLVVEVVVFWVSVVDEMVCWLLVVAEVVSWVMVVVVVEETVSSVMTFCCLHDRDDGICLQKNVHRIDTMQLLARWQLLHEEVSPYSFFAICSEDRSARTYIVFRWNCMGVFVLICIFASACRFGVIL
ncbi:hypothetical protein M514_04868 [Trichuris suis]|uniref:Uncharacterized protein n=1 Tax=Trichuris suis TaxID=68888 RepID=A0A085NUG9_9BILA|nr:hypothetical protein M513_04868 [Trichuris suis]KFD73115.1 hypothetical protein M514_04868 [Trichuris suis]